MRIVIFEGLAALPPGEGFLPGEATALTVGEGSRESAYLGLRPDEGQLAPGPLVVSALGADPPERSTHFHLALLSVDEAGVVHEADGTLEPGVLDRLRTRSLVPLKGHGKHHGLVWEEVGSVLAVPPKGVFGKVWEDHLPQGDGERALRRMIDDSVNLLQETEANRRLRDEGKRPANLLWPWGAGVRLPVPNLALKRLAPGRVSSRSWRLAGLSRLAGYRPSDWWRSNPEAERADLRLVRLAEDPEEALYEVDKWRREHEPFSGAIVLIDGTEATGLRADRPPNGEPFDQRLLQEGGRRPTLWSWLDDAWEAAGNPTD